MTELVSVNLIPQFGAPIVSTSQGASLTEDILATIKRAFYVRQSDAGTAWFRKAPLAQLEAEISSYAHLDENWDGEGAIAISSKAIEATLQFLSIGSDFAQLPEINPNPNGTISLVWRWSTGRASLEIGKTRHSWVVTDRSTGVAQKTSCSGDNEKVSDLGGSDLFRAILISRSIEVSSITKFKMAHAWLSDAEAA